MDYKEASNEYDMLKGCVNRIFVTQDKDELVSLYSGAVYHLSRVFSYGRGRFAGCSESPSQTSQA